MAAINFSTVEVMAPEVAEIIKLSAKLSDEEWASHMKTTSYNLLALLNALGVSSGKTASCRKRFNADAPKMKVFFQKEIENIEKLMGKCNKLISAGSDSLKDIEALLAKAFLKDAEAFLTSIGIAPAEGPRKVRFFPHEPNKKRSSEGKSATAKTYAMTILGMEELPEERCYITLDEALNLSKAVGGKAAVYEKLPLKMFQSLDEFDGTLVKLHKGTRRTLCCIPACCLWPALLANFRSATAKTVTGHGGTLRVEIFVSCPGCKEKEIHIPYAAVCNFVKKVFAEQEAAKEKATKDLSLLDRRKMEDQSMLPIGKLYNNTRFRAAMSNPDFQAFRCPNDKCPCAEEPRFFEPHSSCTKCISDFKSGAISRYHVMQCPSCSTEACGLCNKPRADHSIDGEVCPRKSIITEEMRVEGRKQLPKPILYCKICDVACIRDEGCAHLTCICGHHFCALCEEPMPKGDMGRYGGHKCGKPDHPDAAIFHPGAVWMAPSDVAGYNPHKYHRIYPQRLAMPRVKRYVVIGGGAVGGAGGVAMGGAGGAAMGGAGGGAAAALMHGGGGAANQIALDAALAHQLAAESDEE